MAADPTAIWTADDGRERVVRWSDNTIEAQYLIAGEWKVRPGDREALRHALLALSGAAEDARTVAVIAARILPSIEPNAFESNRRDEAVRQARAILDAAKAGVRA